MPYSALVGLVDLVERPVAYRRQQGLVDVVERIIIVAA